MTSDSFLIEVLASVPSPVTLMRLTEINNPDELLKKFKKDDILVESKLDGHKTQIIKSSENIHLFSRRGEDITGNFPAIVKAMESLPENTLAEGELVYWDHGKQDVTQVTSLAGSSADKAVEKAKSLPGKMKLHLYDILWLKGKDVTGKPFSERRKLLTSVVKVSDIVLLTKQHPFSEWQEVMKDSRQTGGEGVVFKIKDAKYQWKPKGETEPKPFGTMFKFKKGGGKSDSDDYVVYGTTKSKTGKLMAQFGQYHKGKLYAISEIDNFSAENEAEIEKHLKKGLFVIEIGFQERVPGGLRHQKFLRFRDDKKPKDATMHEFHAKHIAEFEPAALERKALFALAALKPDAMELVTTLERVVGKDVSTKIGPISIGNIGGVDGNKLFRVVSKLESNGRTDIVGDAGTSFGPTQMHGPYFLSRLSGMPDAEATTGMSKEEMNNLSTGWLSMLKKLRGAHIWKKVPVDQESLRGLPQIKRLEKTFIRRPDMVIEQRGGRFIGKVVDLGVLRSLGFNVDSEVFKRALNKIYAEYITDNVALSALAQTYLQSVAPLAFQKFKRQFNSANIRRNKALANLIERASVRDLTSRIAAVVRFVRESGYDTTAPGAFSIPQLVFIANSSGVGRVQQFLMNKKPFAPGNLHYLQSSRFKAAIKSLAKTDPDLGSITGQLLAGLPPNGGMAGFHDEKASRIIASLLDISEPVTRLVTILSLAGISQAPTSAGKTVDHARKIITLVERWLNYDYVKPSDLRDAALSLIRIDRETKPHKLVLWTTGDIEHLKRLLPKKMWGMKVDLRADVPRMTFELPMVTEFKDDPTLVNVEARMPVQLFSEYIYLLKQVREDLKRMRKQVPEDQLRRTVFLHVAEQLGYTPEQLKKMLGESGWLRFSWQMPPISKRAVNNGVLAFPGQFAEDIKSGKLEKTIRPTDMPVEVDEVVTAITYSGSIICRIKILSKETMSLCRLEKSFGKHVARSLEHRFGPNRRFVVIRFTRFDINDSDDGMLDEKKRGEVLIDKEGTELTRGQIYDHYAKSAVRKQIMSRIKDKPVLIYLGVGKNEKILKRNHDDKPIVISNDDQGGSEKSNNYWYWVKRRLLSIHEVFGTKTGIGFVDLDLHGGYPLEKAKEYAKKLVPVIKEKYGAQAKIYQSGGAGLHVEFELGKEVDIDSFRKELRDLLDKLNEDFEGITTSTVKGKGMRTDISTLHNKGSLRVPGSLGEVWGKVKKPLSQKTDDDYSNNNFGGKYSDTGPFGDGGAITPMPYRSMVPDQVGVSIASKRRRLFCAAGKGD
jgi:hypothetical protein